MFWNFIVIGQWLVYRIYPFKIWQNILNIVLLWEILAIISWDCAYSLLPHFPSNTWKSGSSLHSLLFSPLKQLCFLLHYRKILKPNSACSFALHLCQKINWTFLPQQFSFLTSPLGISFKIILFLYVIFTFMPVMLLIMLKLYILLCNYIKLVSPCPNLLILNRRNYKYHHFHIFFCED